MIQSGPPAEPVLTALTAFLTSLAVTTSRIRSQLGSACLVWLLCFLWVPLSFSEVVGGTGGSVNGPGLGSLIDLL